MLYFHPVTKIFPGVLYTVPNKILSIAWDCHWKIFLLKNSYPIALSVADEVVDWS